MAAAGRPSPGKLIRAGWDRIAVYLPAILMGAIALGSYWLVRNAPTLADVPTPAAPTHEPDNFMRRFSVRTFDMNGRLKSEIHGTEGRHYPDTDTLEIDQPRIRSFSARGELTVASARLAISNADGSEVQLVGSAVVRREPGTGAGGEQRARLEIRGEFLHAFLDAEKVKSNKPVELIRGDDHFTSDGLDYDHTDQVLELKGRVRGVITPRNAQQP
ncbi:lipopolysaccharide export system protein LptC [Ramlibacter tataouinensis]|uniref:Lipopolysaccharide export system protein LptC n=1 Tax=Ramlibacter tataouinensis TaxID=94132 RepID=A0A127JZR0_9BURK|nr:lipopolysaccharide export system protein LptC [Ramlibacter tataouinensis]